MADYANKSDSFKKFDQSLKKGAPSMQQQAANAKKFREALAAKKSAKPASQGEARIRERGGRSR